MVNKDGLRERKEGFKEVSGNERRSEEKEESNEGGEGKRRRRKGFEGERRGEMSALVWRRGKESTGGVVER